MHKLLAIALGVGMCAGVAAQEKYPSQPVQVILPYAAGGGVDIMGRAFSAEMSRVLGQAFVVVNRDGAAGAIGFGALAGAKPDGYTIAFSPNTPVTQLPHIMKSLAYGFDSVVPVCQVFENVFAVVVTQSSPYQTLADLLAAARAAPGKLAYGHAGPGTIPHLSMAALANAAGVSLTAVPYRGDAPMLPQMMSGDLAFGVPGISSIVGRDLRVLAVFSQRRHPAYRDVRTVPELGFPDVAPGLNGLWAPRSTPRPVLEVLENACEQAAQSASFRERAAKLSQPVVFLRSADFAKRLAADYELKGRLIRELGLKQE